MHTHFITRYHVEGDGHSLTNRSPPSGGDQCHLVGGEGNWLVVTNVISSLVCLFYCVTLTCNENKREMILRYNTVPTSYNYGQHKTIVGSIIFKRGRKYNTIQVHVGMYMYIGTKLFSPNKDVNENESDCSAYHTTN